ncbi:MAG: ribokinase, partial [Candidatus Njordarchaeota archaeon]
MSTYIMAALGNPVFDIIETPYIRTNGRVLSGCSVNAALTIGKLGGKSIVIGTVGADYHEEMINKLKQYNVDSFTLL